MVRLASSLLLLITGLSLTACGSSIDYDRQGLERSQQMWQQRLDSLPIGATEAQLRDWQNKCSPCDAFFLSLTIQTNEQKQVVKKELKALGSCI